jgi:pre-mRNA-processing factor 17
MHSIPIVRLHPFGNNLVGQSMDDKLVVFDCKVGIKTNKQKVFIGHKNQGFGTGITFSPDGQFVCSGDSDGSLWFWDWKNTKNLRTLKAHEGVCIDVDWHPLDPSRMVSAGWDGTIKMWE